MDLRATAGRIRRRAFPSIPYFATDDVEIGRNVTFDAHVRFNCQTVRIGNGTTFHNDIEVNASHFEIGNYGTIYDGCLFAGGSYRIGHNFWLGHGAIVDGSGGTTIGDNVGVGAHSQLWTHIAFGDTLQGCRFHGSKQLVIGNDVWFVGHCLVSPITAGDRSVAMLGSVVVKDMEPDRTYAGSPAADQTDRFGAQFEQRGVTERVDDLNARLDALLPDPRDRALVKVATNESEAHLSALPNTLVLNVENRTYLDVHHPLEYQVIRELLPAAKFTPRSP
jgi:acetyltransferase-like isoleucine patch superfamily enzyme